MPIPDFQSLMLPALKALSAGAEKPISEIRNHIAEAQGLTPEEMQELLPSGRQPVVYPFEILSYLFLSFDRFLACTISAKWFLPAQQTSVGREDDQLHLRRPLALY